MGHTWFYGLKLKVTSAVLIPRPETEELVHWIISDSKTPNKVFRILDIGTGSGCIAIALKNYFKNNADLIAIDVSQHALAVAKENAISNGLEIQFIQRNFLEEGFTGLGDFDIIVSNPPYVSKADLTEQEIANLNYEPAIALFPDNQDPDIFYNTINLQLHLSLNKGGACYLELNEFRSAEIRSLFSEKYWSGIEVREDMQGKPRMLKLINRNP